MIILETSCEPPLLAQRLSFPESPPLLSVPPLAPVSATEDTLAGVPARPAWKDVFHRTLCTCLKIWFQELACCNNIYYDSNYVAREAQGDCHQCHATVFFFMRRGDLFLHEWQCMGLLLSHGDQSQIHRRERVA